MKKTLFFALILLLSISLVGCINRGSGGQLENDGLPKEKPQQSNNSDNIAVAGLVKNFGSKLQAVSLQAPKEIVNKSIQDNYGDFVSPALLVKWQNNPENAPGRMVSSPWPDRIEILAIEKLEEGMYKVRGEIIEITSEEKVNGGFAAKRPITLDVTKTGNRWLISAVSLDAYRK